jgi:hypothetical protein
MVDTLAADHVRATFTTRAGGDAPSTDTCYIRRPCDE